MSDVQAKLAEFKEDFGLFIEAGFVAVKQLDGVGAARIFNAAQLLRPESSAPQIGLGYIALNKLEVKEATKIFEDVTRKEPDNHLAQTFLGMCFLLTKAKRSKGEKLIQEILEKAKEPTIQNLGKLALEWSKKDLSKKASPFYDATGEKEE